MLIKSWKVLPHLDIRANNGIDYLKQIQFEERAGDPSDSDLVDGRLYHQTGVGLRIYEAGAWSTLGTGGGSSTFVGLTDTPANFTSANNKILKVNTGATAVEFVTLSGDVSIGATGIAAIGSDVIINADVKSDAAIAYSKLNLTGAVLDGDLAGSIGVGKVTLAQGSVIVGSAGGVGVALDAKTTTQILVGNGTTITSVAIGGDASMANDGTLSVSDLTIASEAAGDILYFDGSNWIRLAKPGASDLYLEGGTTPAWTAVSAGIASSLAQNVTCEAGTNDYTLAFTTLTSSASTITIPDLAGQNRTFAFIDQAQTITANQIFEYGLLFLGDNDNGQTLQILVNENMTGDKTLTILPGDGSRTLTLGGDLTLTGDLITVGDDSLTFTTGGATDVTLPTTGTVSTLAGAEALSNKTLTAPKIVTTDAITDAGGDAYLTFVEDATPRDSFQITTGDVGLGARFEVITADTNANMILAAAGTGDIQIDNGTELTFLRAAQDALIVVANQTGEDHTFNIPDIATNASDTFAFIAEAQTLTNKTIDVDSNTVTNINADELDSVGNGAYGITFLFRETITNVGGDTTVVENSTFKFRVLDVWSVNTSGDGGTWKVKSDGGDITETVTVAANDKDIDRATQIDNTNQDVAATTGDLFITSDAGLDAEIYILCMRVD